MYTTPPEALDNEQILFFLVMCLYTWATAFLNSE